MKGAAYHFDDDAALDAAGLIDPETGELDAWLTRRPGPVWIVEPELSDPDPETGERAVTAPGQPSRPIVILAPDPIPGLEADRIDPPGLAGFA